MTEQLQNYQQIAPISGEPGVFLVQDRQTQALYVKKQLTVYNADIYRYLLDHPIANTPRLQQIVEDQGVLTVIEEYIPGETLEQHLFKNGVLSEMQATRIAIDLCHILESFHNCQPAIVNRDIKPSNIILTPEGTVKLVDINTAKWVNEHAARDTVLLGTQGYAAPEQYGFGASGKLTDIYAVGVLLNVMLTGKLPSEKLAAGDLGRIVQKCTHLSPDSRYQSMEALLTALENPKKQEHPRWLQYLPPGFRHQNILGWLVSASCYAFLLFVCFNLEVEGKFHAFYYRTSVTLMVLGIIFFSGNYLNIHKAFFLTRSRHFFIRWLGILIVDLALVALWTSLYILLSSTGIF